MCRLDAAPEQRLDEADGKEALIPAEGGGREPQPALGSLQQRQAPRGLGRHGAEDLGAEAEEDPVPILHEGIHGIAREGGGPRRAFRHEPAVGVGPPAADSPLPSSVCTSLVADYGTWSTMEVQILQCLCQHPASLENSARREKVQCSCRCKSGLGELSVRPSSYRGSKEGDRLAEALGTSAHHGWVCKPTGRNTCEARAGLEREVVSADLPELQGRPWDRAGATDQ